MLAYAITGVAGRFGYLQRDRSASRCPASGLGQRASSPTRLTWIWRHGATRAYVNTQLENYQRARAVPVVRVRDPPGRPVRARPLVVTPTSPSVRGPARGRVRGRERGRRLGRRRDRTAAPVGGAEHRAHVLARADRARGSRPAPDSSCVLDADRRAPGRAGRADGARRAAVAHRVRREHRRRQPPADPRPARRSPFDQLVVDPATGQRLLAYPTSALGDNGVFPLEVDLRSAADESLAHFVTHVVVAPVGADGALTVGAAAQRRVGVAAAGRARIPRVAGIAPNNPTTLADLEPSGRLGRQATQLAAEPRRAADPRPQPRDARGVERARHEVARAGGRRRRPMPARRYRGRNQVLAGPFVPLDLPSHRARRPRGRGHLDSGTRPGELSRGVATLESFFGAHVDPSTALPGPLDAVGAAAPSRARACVSSSSRAPRSTPVEREVHARAPVQGADGRRATTPARVTVLATDAGLEQFLTRRRAAAPARRAPARRARARRRRAAEHRSAASRSPTRPPGTPTTRSSPRSSPGCAGTRCVRADDRRKGCCRRCRWRPSTTSPTARPCSASSRPTHRRSRRSRAAQYAQGVKQPRRGRGAGGAGERSTPSPSADRALASSHGVGVGEPAGPRRSAPAARLDRHARSTATSTRSRCNRRAPSPSRRARPRSRSASGTTGTDVVTVHAPARERPPAVPRGRRAVTSTLAGEAQHDGAGRGRDARLGHRAGADDGHDAGGLPIGDQTMIKVRSTFVSGVGVFLTVGAIVFLVLWWGWDIHRRRKKRAREQHPTYRLAPPSGHARVTKRPGPHSSRRKPRSGRRGGASPVPRRGGDSSTTPVSSSRGRTPPSRRRRSSGRARWSRSAPRSRASPASCASPRSRTRSGASTLAGTYSYANETPNIVYELLLGGVLTATLVPLFVRYHESDDDDATSAIFTVAIVALVGDHVVGVLARAVDRRPLHAQRARARTRPRSRSSPPRSLRLLHAADALLRHRRARHRDAQRAPTVRRGRVRAGPQQRRRRSRCS